MAKKTGLGKGLDALFAETSESIEEKIEPTKLRISEIQPRSGQPRKNFDKDALAALADSIAQNGLIQPIAVRSTPSGLYEIIAGERRWRASKLAGLTEVPVIIIDSDDRKTAELSLIENIQREDLNPIEEAMAYRSLMSEFGLTQEMVAERVGISRAAVANKLRLLDLSSDVYTHLVSGDLSEGHCRALLGLRDKAKISEIATLVIERELSVRQVEELVRRTNDNSQKVVEDDEDRPRSVKDVDYVAELEKRIRQTIGRAVKIVDGKKTKKLEIEYTDNADLDDLLRLLCGEDFLTE